ncbi:helix-turn-helix transcriptional regulator [Salmonella enterica subsp. enterica serovar Typhi]|nr:helix-turn-helix transcriptional regulator [Salmonella enterica subsp. enterica serovar Typhi]
MAEKSGVSLALLGAVERGNRRADDQILTKIADCLGITLADLKPES